MMVTLGMDAHKRTHTVSAADEAGAGLSHETVPSTPEGHLRLLGWAEQFPQRCWTIEDCRHLSRRLEADLLRAGEQVVRVPPKMMAAIRRRARTRGRSDPIDALAVARAALSEPGLPAAHLDGPARQLRLHQSRGIPTRPEERGNSRWTTHQGLLPLRCHTPESGVHQTASSPRPRSRSRREALPA
jgi:transposase